MADNRQLDKTFGDRLQEIYKLVVFRSEDFKEVRSFNLSLASIYTAVSMISLFFIVMFYCLFAYTPLKQFIPGYGQIEANGQFIEMIENIDEITYKLEAQQTYLDAFKRVLMAPDWDGTSQGYKTKSNSRKENTTVYSSVSAEQRVDVSRMKLSEGTDLNYSIYATMRTSNVIKPVEGVISSEFMPEIRHFGVDILAPKDTPVKSMMDGFIIISGWDLETGYTVGVQHEGNILSFYKHNSILLKEKGTFVRAGEALAIIGNTGTLSSGPHLHFELWHNGKPVNPGDFINFE